MASNQLTFGLSDSILGDLRRVFSAYPEIEQVLIFGSRAKGAFKDGSDIDLAVIASAMSDQRFTQLWNELDGLPLVFKMDVLHWDRLGNERLKNKIPGEGKVLYPSPTANLF
ncbi:MAG: DNA polymerase subunit beta [Zetaproteobacteria bacterium CG_4_9_14_3_um_filter_49_83]|nr:MAG: DNA polymerase subunit beta [Zetaproteobacteria bacterium CG17_big_fil_post_rev_8_21_14_2_50_50_13]PIV29043.1 MAG: DNA polymerase subunit beta [Zetaproteobacteria bacterium CG02_land_8_20_14_3_00_50_9]PIY56417.1 MAG: DNA polymerase subunit beta [Zetaproteobacteria bacterium CG_4_10_14_0_8_um_filter_49_80]PJA34056.1 MAG: DNA polymerase subunit beta [Zetaproteobacteria bacterium CG_4_9_14_3_um_filter_49_83]